MPRGINAYDEGRIQGRNVANANSSNIVSPGIVTDGLVLHLDAGNYQSYPIAGTTWYDLSGQGANGTLTNGPTYIRDGGGAIDCGVSSNFINLPTSAGNFTTQDFSFVVWLNITSATTSTAGNGPVPFWKGDYRTNGYYSQIVQGTAPLSYLFVTNQSGAHQVTESTNSLNLATWYCLCLTRAGSSVRTYINGQDATATAGTHISPAAATGNNLRINTYNAVVYGDVTYAVFSAYERMLTPTEVSQNFNALRARFNI